MLLCHTIINPPNHLRTAIGRMAGRQSHPISSPTPSQTRPSAQSSFSRRYQCTGASTYNLSAPSISSPPAAECHSTGRAQSRQGMHRAPGPSTIPRIPLPSLLQCTQHIFSRLRKLTPIKTKGINLRNRLTSKCVRCSRRKKMLGKCPRPIVNLPGNQAQGNHLLATAMQGSFNLVRLFGEKTSNGPFRGWMTG